VLNKIFRNGLKPANADLSTLSLTLPGLYGINTFINSGKSILSVSTLKLSAHVLGSLMVTEKISMPIGFVA
jgi:hypothetical protein